MDYINSLTDDDGINFQTGDHILLICINLTDKLLLTLCLRRVLTEIVIHLSSDHMV